MEMAFQYPIIYIISVGWGQIYVIVYIIFEYVQKPFSLWKTNINNSIYLYIGYTPKSVTIAMYGSWGANR
jgi:hypothetical protein